MLQGLKTLDVLKVLRDHPETMRPLLTGCNVRKLSADALESLMVPVFSEQGSNRRAREEELWLKWSMFLFKVEGKYKRLFYVIQILSTDFAASLPPNQTFLVGTSLGAVI